MRMLTRSPCDGGSPAAVARRPGERTTQPKIGWNWAQEPEHNDGADGERGLKGAVMDCIEDAENDAFEVVCCP